MVRLVISTKYGMTHEAEVRDVREARHEIERFNRTYLSNHPRDVIADMCVVDRFGNIVSRMRGGDLEDFS
jgi:hypothetical protein